MSVIYKAAKIQELWKKKKVFTYMLIFSIDLTLQPSSDPRVSVTEVFQTAILRLPMRHTFRGSTSQQQFLSPQGQYHIQVHVLSPYHNSA